MCPQYVGKCTGQPPWCCSPARRAPLRAGEFVTLIGAILRFAVTWKPAHVDLQVIGVILMIAGVAGLIISVTLLVVRRRGRASAEVYEERRYTEPPA